MFTSSELSNFENGISSEKLLEMALHSMHIEFSWQIYRFKRTGVPQLEPEDMFWNEILSEFKPCLVGMIQFYM